MLQLQLEESQADSSRTQELEKDVKEKNALIGKLRYEGMSSLSPCVSGIHLTPLIPKLS